MCAAPRQHLVVAKAEGAVAGFAILHAGERLALLEYLAVDESLRGRGLGADLYRRCREGLGGLPLLIEVESDAAAHPERALRTRRKAFYRRLGCRELRGLVFILPLGDRPPPIDLLVDAPVADVGRETAAAWLREIYLSVYGCAADDPRLLRMLAALPERLELA